MGWRYSLEHLLWSAIFSDFLGPSQSILEPVPPIFFQVDSLDLSLIFSKKPGLIPLLFILRLLIHTALCYKFLQGTQSV